MEGRKEGRHFDRRAGSHLPQKRQALQLVDLRSRLLLKRGFGSSFTWDGKID